ncbi:hypothetical protein Amsp01_096690 [Amycolatopsis sp. NBRC 101858]|nr:hypothetical protein Amsp01_096690 [Amycolatopsis sp. NBRC 101858]
MPKTTSAPTASSERTRDCAPVTRTGVPAGGAGFGRAPGVPGVGPGFASLRDVALVIGSASWVSVSLVRVFFGARLVRWGGESLPVGNKKPSPTVRSHEGSRVDAAESLP